MSDHGCCEAKDYGYPCQCYGLRKHRSRMAEDDGYADYLYDLERDRQMMAQVEKE